MTINMHLDVDRQRRMLGATALAWILPTAASAASQPQTPSVSQGHVNLPTVMESYYGFSSQQLRWAELSGRAYWQARYI